MGPAQPLADSKTAKVALDKEDKFLLEKCGNKGIRFMSTCEEAMVGMEAFLEKHTKAPVQEAPMKKSPVQEAPMQKTPVQEALVKKIPVQEAPMQKTPVQEAPMKKTPVQEVPMQKTPVQEALMRKTSALEAPMQKTPVQDAPMQKAPPQEASVKAEDIEADIIECTNKSKPRLPEAADPDETEYSSSFGDTVSGTDNYSGLSEAEVESGFCDDNGLTNAFDAFNDIFHQRKKKETRHWREYIRPLMWRCKWTELRMMEVESQALNYARELAKYDQGKQSFVSEPMLEPFGSKSLPFTAQNARKSAMKRMRRRRVEDTTDVGSYMLHHNLFSYLESKRPNAECFSVFDDFGCPVTTDQNVHGDNEFGIHDDQYFFDSRNRQNSLENLLLKIEVVQNRVHKLRTQIDDVMSKYGIKFSSSENLSLIAPFEAQTSCAPSPTFSVGNGDAASVAPVYCSAQHIPEFDIGDLVMTDAALSSYEEGIDIPDIIESTMKLLSSDAIFNQPQMGDSSEDIVGEVLIHDPVTDIGTQRFDGISDQSMEKHNPELIGVGKQEPKTNVIDLAPESVTVPREKSTLESSLVSEFHVPKTKRKRGERKAGSRVWSRKCAPGEPDSL